MACGPACHVVAKCCAVQSDGVAVAVDYISQWCCMFIDPTTAIVIAIATLANGAQVMVLHVHGAYHCIVSRESKVGDSGGSRILPRGIKDSTE